MKSNWSQLTLAAAIMIVTVSVMPVPVMSQFRYPSQTGAHSLALGGAGVGGLMDTYTGLLNPASIVKINETRVAFQSAFEMSRTTIEPVGTSYRENGESLDTLQAVPSLASVLNFGSSIFSMGVYAHARENTRFGFGNETLFRYHMREFRFNATSLDISLGVIPIPNFSFGLNLGYLHAEASAMRKESPLTNNSDPDSDLDFRWEAEFEDIAEFFPSAGMLWSPNYRFDLGFVFQPPAAYHFKGDLAVTLPESLGGTIYRTDLEKLRVTIPGSLQVGTHWIASDRVDVFVDIKWTQFSQIDDMNLVMERPRDPYLPFEYRTRVDLSDRWSLHAGAEFMVSDRTTLRFGAFHSTEVSDETNGSIVWAYPAQTGLSAGIDFKVLGWDLEIGAHHAFSGQTRNDFSPTSLPMLPIDQVDVTQETTSLSIGLSKSF